MFLLESSLRELYDSAVEAFPNTTRRQHSTNTIVISHIDWTPFLGVKTLMVKAIAQNEGKEYNPMIVLKSVRFHEAYDEPELVRIIDATEQTYYLEQLSYDETPVLVRCNCGDFYWRFCHADHLSSDLYGRNRKKYEAIHNPGAANPDNAKGLCKHLMKLVKTLDETKMFG